MHRGFTLIEMLVSVAIFTVVMVIALGALLAMSAADRRAEAMKSAVNNLNFALDSMTRDIRTGYNWGCNATPGQNCTGGAQEMTYTSAYYGYVRYAYDTNASDCDQSGSAIGCIVRYTSPDNITWSAAQPLTDPNIDITNLTFYIVGAPQGATDNVQPKLVITLTGSVAIDATASSTLRLQTAVTQRLYDQ